MFENYPDVVRPLQLCQMLQIGRTKMYHLIHSGTIPSRKIGSNYFIRKVDVIHFLRENK